MTTENTVSVESWLASLQVGSVVAVISGYLRSAVSIETVTHATKTQVHVGGLKFRRATSSEMGEGYSRRARIAQPTQDMRDKARTQRLTAWLADLVNRPIGGGKPTLAQLEAMNAAYHNATTKAPE